ncbi:hypothetical protein [Pontibacter mucosus]|uniref:hypothetical protein n=1 Tax=Pontibacter mucosus TaxID=1649266 RepID=UPI00147630EE|nr:hypothetical protein [Pontibacter mucosus]
MLRSSHHYGGVEELNFLFYLRLVIKDKEVDLITKDTKNLGGERNLGAAVFERKYSPDR